MITFAYLSFKHCTNTTRVCIYARIFKFQALHKHHTCVYLCAHVCVWACVRVCVCHVVRRLRTILSKAARHKHPLDAAHWHNASRAQNYTQHHVCVHGYT